LKKLRRHHNNTAGRILRLGRIAVSAGILAAATLLSTSAWAKTALALGWVEKIQIMPLALSGAVSALAIWLLVTLVFGRVYCSTVCPLGTLQDVISRIPRNNRRWRQNHPYRFTPANNKFRYLWLLAVILCAVTGLTVVAAALDPYSVFGRIVSHLTRPVAELIGGKEVVAGSALAFLFAATALLVVGVSAWWRGRLVCNTACPVGSTLSLASRRPLFHFDIDTDVCVNCRACEYVCKAQCISMTDHTVDSSRCVVCFDCVAVCDEGAIRYTTSRKRLAIPMLQATKNISLSSCDNISTCSSISSTTEPTNPTEPGPERGASSATRCASTSRMDSRC